MTSSAEALASYLEENYCLVILDVQLSDTDSVGMLRAMHSAKHTPNLVLTDPLYPQEIVELLHAGADTCMENPLNMEVCAAQANALIKLYVEADINHNQHKPVVHGSELLISPRYRQVMVDGRHLALTKKEFDILHCLASRPGQIFSCEQLYDHVWGDSLAVAVDDIVVIVFVARVQQRELLVHEVLVELQEPCVDKKDTGKKQRNKIKKYGKNRGNKGNKGKEKFYFSK